MHVTSWSTFALLCACLAITTPVEARPAAERMGWALPWAAEEPSPIPSASKTALRHSWLAAKRDPGQPSGLPVSNCFAPDGKCTWENAFGGALPDKAYDIAALPDGGIVAVGHTRAPRGIGHDILAMRIDRTGRLVWRRTFGGPREDHAYGVALAGSEDLIVAGFTQSKGRGMSDIWIARFDRNGFLLWEKTFGGALDDRARTITATADGYFAIAGFTKSGGTPEGDAWIIKIDGNGRPAWEKRLGGTGSDGIFNIKSRPDGSLIATGYAAADDSAGYDLWVVCLGPDGELRWERTFGKNAFDSGTAVEITAEGGCIVAGITSTRGLRDDEAWVLRLDPLGKLLWQRTLGGEKADNPWAVLRLDAGHYAVVMATSSWGAGSADAWIVCFDIDGRRKWDRLYGGRLWDRPTAATLATDDGFYIGGYTTSFGNGFEDFWLLKLDATGNR